MNFKIIFGLRVKLSIDIIFLKTDYVLNFQITLHLAFSRVLLKTFFGNFFLYVY